MTINLSDNIRKLLKLPPWGNRQAANAISSKVERYSLIMAEEKNQIIMMFPIEEIELFHNLCKNTKFVPAIKCKDGILLEVVNAADDMFNGLDRNKIKNKLQSLTTLQNIALVEVLEDYADLN